MQARAAIPVTGLGCLCAAGDSVSRCLEALDAGRRAPAPPRHFVSEHKDPYPVFEVPGDFSDSSGAKGQAMTRTVAMALHVAREALAQAGLDAQTLGARRVGVCLGTSVGASLNFLDFYRRTLAGEQPGVEPLTRYMHSNPALAVARELGCTGPVLTVTNACSSGADAIGLGADWIRAGLCDIVLAGGADELSPVTYSGFIRLMITSQEPCRPFDVRRTGLNLGEGAAVLVLESEASRAGRKATACGRMLGYGTTADGHHITAPKPDGSGLRAAIHRAMGEAGASFDSLSFVNAHGTGTRNNDQVEALVARELYPRIPVLATKGMTGHTLGAAGAIEAVFTLSHLGRGSLPHSVGFAQPDPDLNFTPVAASTPVAGDVALSQSLAFGGNNSVLALGRGESS